jgi:hypothetical protein
MAGKLNLKINQGETFRHTLLWKDSNEVAIDLTGYTARMHVRAKIEDTSTLIVLTTENGRIVISNPAQGEIKLYISATDTTTMTWTSGVYDLEMVNAGGDVIRLIEGKVSVTKEVTR